MLFARNYYWNKNDSYAWVSILRCRVQMLKQVLKMYIVHRKQKVVYDVRENPQHSRKKLFEQSREPKHPTEYGVEFRIEPRRHLTVESSHHLTNVWARAREIFTFAEIKEEPY